MVYRLAADIVLLVHLGFILFVVAGGLLCLRRLRWAWLHLPAVLWGVWVEWSGSICPLTPLENYFRSMGTRDNYSVGFIEHYLVPLIYPSTLTMQMQWLLGGLALGINLLVYGFVLKKHRDTPSRVDE